MFSQIAQRVRSRLGAPTATQNFALRQISSGESFPLRPTTIVGKLRSSDIVLREGLPSRRHALLSIEDGQLLVEDLKSRNGTYVNGFKIAARTKVYGGYRIKFDIQEFLVLGPPAPEGDLENLDTLVRPSTSILATPTVPIHLPKFLPPAGAPENPPTAADAPVPQQPRARGSETVLDVPPSPPLSAEGLRRAEASRDFAWRYKEKTVVMTQRLRQVPPGADEPLELVYVPTLLVRAGPLAEQRFEMRPEQKGKQKWTIGNDAGNQLVLDEPRVSGKHAVISVVEDKWQVVDQLSKNGTFVNAVRVGISSLSSGDKIKFGPVEAVFILPAKLIRLTAIDGVWRVLTIKALLALVGFALTAFALYELWHLDPWHWHT